MIAVLLALALMCGSERWPVKTCTDADASACLAASTPTTITGLRAIQARPWHLKSSRWPEEHTVYQVQADVLGYKLEDDGDYHVVIAEPSDHALTMVAETPDPTCAQGSPAQAQIAHGRAAFLKLFAEPKTVGKFLTLKAPVRVTITGVFFLDHKHGETGRAPNDAELHPITDITQ